MSRLPGVAVYDPPLLLISAGAGPGVGRGQGRKQGYMASAKGACQRIQDIQAQVRECISIGAMLYNSGEIRACFWLYYGCAQQLQQILGPLKRQNPHGVVAPIGSGHEGRLTGTVDGENAADFGTHQYARNADGRSNLSREGDDGQAWKLRSAAEALWSATCVVQWVDPDADAWALRRGFDAVLALSCDVTSGAMQANLHVNSLAHVIEGGYDSTLEAETASVGGVRTAPQTGGMHLLGPSSPEEIRLTVEEDSRKGTKEVHAGSEFMGASLMALECESGRDNQQTQGSEPVRPRGAKIDGTTDVQPVFGSHAAVNLVSGVGFPVESPFNSFWHGLLQGDRQRRERTEPQEPTLAGTQAQHHYRVGPGSKTRAAIDEGDTDTLCDDVAAAARAESSGDRLPRGPLSSVQALSPPLVVTREVGVGKVFLSAVPKVFVPLVGAETRLMVTRDEQSFCRVLPRVDNYRDVNYVRVSRLPSMVFSGWCSLTGYCQLRAASAVPLVLSAYYGIYIRAIVGDQFSEGTLRLTVNDSSCDKTSFFSVAVQFRRDFAGIGKIEGVGTVADDGSVTHLIPFAGHGWEFLREMEPAGTARRLDTDAVTQVGLLVKGAGRDFAIELQEIGLYRS
ncbi:unnamed protein product [Amoebophrya sp. A25]|nr:unnamed protein product [Amoebophrya sp. A25]|eukprot:GSA25T00021613001.1